MKIKIHDKPPLLRLRQASVTFGTARVGPFDIVVCEGERLAVLGPSGAGKSTLLKLMAKELVCTSGDIALNGQSLRTWPLAALSRRRAVLPQSHGVAFGLPVELVIGLGRVARAAAPDLADIVRAAATHAYAGHLLSRRFDTLSGGEQARVQLARVFAQLWDIECGLILVDEPLAALDPGLQFDLIASLDDFARARRHAVIAVLHDINQALAAFDRLLLIRAGQLVDDVRSDITALPRLEWLYGVRLANATTDDGALVVIPTRRFASAGAGSLSVNSLTSENVVTDEELS